MECRSLLLGAAAGAAAFAILDRLRRRRLRGGTYHAGMIRARPELIEQYQQLHDKTWEEVMARMYASNMRDFVVWFHPTTNMMFHQFIYVGTDFDADMVRIAADPVVRFWWTYCEPCQEPLHWSGPPPSQGGAGDPAVVAAPAGQSLRGLGGRLFPAPGSEPVLHAKPPGRQDVHQGLAASCAQPDGPGSRVDELQTAALCRELRPRCWHCRTIVMHGCAMAFEEDARVVCGSDRPRYRAGAPVVRMMWSAGVLRYG